MAPQFDGAVEYAIEEEEDPAQNRCGGESAATDCRGNRTFYCPQPRPR